MQRQCRRSWDFFMVFIQTKVTLWKVVLFQRISSKNRNSAHHLIFQPCLWSMICSRKANDQRRKLIWVFPKIVGFPPKSSILILFSIINHPFWGIAIFGNTHLKKTHNEIDSLIKLSEHKSLLLDLALSDSSSLRSAYTLTYTTNTVQL